MIVVVVLDLVSVVEGVVGWGSGFVVGIVIVSVFSVCSLSSSFKFLIIDEPNNSFIILLSFSDSNLLVVNSTEILLPIIIWLFGILNIWPEPT